MDFDVFMEAFMVGVRHAFEQADDVGMPWDGGYVFTAYQHCELPDLFSWVAGGDHEDAVREEIRDCLVEKSYASRWWAEMEPDEAFSPAWTEFREQISTGHASSSGLARIRRSTTWAPAMCLLRVLSVRL